MKATLILREKFVMPDGMIMEIVIWKLAKATTERPHGYRLFFGSPTGECLVRYDNETGKGDHIHYGVKEVKYKFETVQKLRSDFWYEVKRMGVYESE